MAHKKDKKPKDRGQEEKKGRSKGEIARILKMMHQRDSSPADDTMPLVPRRKGYGAV
jgi:hypothetical protein